MEITTVGIDIAKSVFHVVAVNTMGTPVKKKQLQRKELITLAVASLPLAGGRGIARYAISEMHYLSSIKLSSMTRHERFGMT